MAKSQPLPEQPRPAKPQPELKRSPKPEPEIKQPVTPAKPEVGEDQGDSGPDKDNPITEQSRRVAFLDSMPDEDGDPEE